VTLRASVEATGESIDLDGLTGPGCTEIEGIPYSKALLGFANAFMDTDVEALTAARETLVQKMSVEAMVDAAGVASNFQRMVRIADSTGIPLDDWGDDALNVMTEELNDTLDINNL
jgi:hypothetical protein